MRRARQSWKAGLTGAVLAVAAGCGGDSGTGQDVAASVAVGRASALGSRLAGVSDADFAEAQAAFTAVESITDGVGPIFNERSCAGCHSLGAVGGAGENIERRFGRFVNGAFDSMAARGGSLRQLFTLGTFNNGNTLCIVPQEAEPAGATIHNVGRRTVPLFGLGLVDAMPDSFFDSLAAGEPSAVRGVVNRVRVLLPNPADPTQGVGTVRVARFGWKAGVPSLLQFSADAYLNEMGITTQHCFKGTSILSFATESAPNGVPMPVGCDDLAPPAPAGVPAGVDDAVGACGGGRTELQDDVALFTTFMTFLAPPPRDLSDQISITRGDPIFTRIGCASCHTRTAFVTPPSPANGVPGNFAFHPYSDFLAHDMGSLGDQIGNDGDPLAVTRRMRTAPLWGVRFQNRLLHDGRAGNVEEAVRAHDGQGAASRDAFNGLSSDDKHAVVQFVRSL